MTAEGPSEEARRPKGVKVADLPALFASLPRLTEAEAADFAKDLEEARTESARRRLVDRWAAAEADSPLPNRKNDEPKMIRGLRTVLYHVTDLAAAKAWYARVLEREPYFDQPFYIGFDVGGFELGLVPDGTPGPGGTVAYWGVADAAAALDRLLTLGATAREPLQEVGEGIKVAAVADPFGNTFGVIENPHFSPARVE